MGKIESEKIKAPYLVRVSRDAARGLFKIGISLIFSILLAGCTFPRTAAATMYQPGETLEPDCAPGSANCGVAVQNFDTSQVPENGNLYYTDTRARNALQVTGTPLTYDSNTGIFGINQADAGNSGYLLASDWNIFNDKQGALGFIPANPANNLSDLANTAIARANLGFFGGNKITIFSTGAIGLASNDISQFVNDSGYLTSSTTVTVAQGGTGTADGSITGTGALSFTSNAASAITLDSGTTGTVNVGTGNNIKTINIGTGIAGNTIQIGTDNTVADNLTIGSARDTATIGAGTLNISNVGSPLNGSRVLCIKSNRVRIGASSSSCNSSSLRSKHDINNLELGLDAIGKLRPVNFYYNDIDTLNNGMIAEEVYNIIPTAVVLDSEGLPYALDYNEITPVIINAIKETTALMGGIAGVGGSDGGVSALIAAIQSEAARDPVAVIFNKISASKQFLADFAAARVTAVRGYFDEAFAEKVHTRQICVERSDGSEICVNGDQLNSLLQNVNSDPAMTAVPSGNGVSSDNSNPDSGSPPVAPVAIEAETPTDTLPLPIETADTVTVESTPALEEAIIASEFQPEASLPAEDPADTDILTISGE